MVEKEPFIGPERVCGVSYTLARRSVSQLVVGRNEEQCAVYEDAQGSVNTHIEEALRLIYGERLDS